MTVDQVRARIRAALRASDDLRGLKWRGKADPYAGHCYVASEAAWWALGGPASGWKPVVVRHEGGTHWFLRHTDGRVLDLTAEQFKTAVPYPAGRGCGWPSWRVGVAPKPSKRTAALLDRAGLPPQGQRARRRGLRAVRTREEVFARFQQVARKVWPDTDEARLRVTLDPTPFVGERGNKGALAAIGHTGRVTAWAIQDRIIRPLDQPRLMLADGALALPADKLDALLIHEACHLGHGGHGRDFVAHCTKHGGALSGSSLVSGEGPRLEYQEAKGKRFRVVHTFAVGTTTAEIRAWHTAAIRDRRLPIGSYRIAY